MRVRVRVRLHVTHGIPIEPSFYVETNLLKIHKLVSGCQFLIITTGWDWAHSRKRRPVQKALLPPQT